MKKILSIILIFALSTSLVACSSSDISLHDAFKKMQDVRAIETSTDISFKLEGEGLGEQETLQLNEVARFINEMSLNIKQKALGNDDKTNAKSESVVKLAFMGMPIELNVWSDIDLETRDMKTIIQIPEMLLGIMASNPMAAAMDNPLMGKEYIVYDMAKVMEVEGQELDYKEMIKFQEEFQAKLIKFMEDIQKDLKLDSDIIKLVEEKDIDGEKIKVYRINLDDQSLRAVISDVVDYILENDSTKEFLVEYMNGYMEVLKDTGMVEEFSDEELQDLEEDLAEMEEDLDQHLKVMKEEFKLFMEKYKDLKILGEEGINILYYVNQEGYIIEEDGVMDFNFDLEHFAKLSQAEEEDQEEMLFPGPEMKGKIKFKISYTTKNMNINSKDIIITMPETTVENSVDMQEMMEEQLEQQIKMLEGMEG